MIEPGIVGILLIVANIVFSYKGFTNDLFFDGYKFEVDRILVSKDYKRLITSGFLHVSWTHLIFNMLSLLAFSGLLESNLGEIKFLIIYFASLVGGDLLSLFIHRNHGDYTAVGASGAVCGVIFASIALFPGLGIGLFGIPLSIPSWLYGILYVLISIYGIKSNRGNIGHDAHLGGALVGMIVALLLRPSAFIPNYLTILIIALPTVAFICLIIARPHMLLVDNFHFKKRAKVYSINRKPRKKKIDRQQEIDSILDKINTHGMNSLSKSEKERLEQFSKTGRDN
jgi:membrane associated rhomboid family serine protease